MAEAKVIPFDDDRPRGGAGRAARGRPSHGPRRTGGDGGQSGQGDREPDRETQEGVQGAGRAPLTAVPEPA
ncbi:MAG TPA: glycerol acyltransferase, partial [Streptomyces sp.]|nr:glycerol acyltransferase [Streptomyces sp.]